MYKKTNFRKSAFATLITIVSLALGMSLMSSDALADHDSTMVGNQFSADGLRTDGDSVIWSQRVTSQVREYVVVDLATGNQQQVLEDTDLVRDPDISGDHIVWRQQDVIYLKNISSGEQIEVTRGEEAWARHSPRIEGDWVIWQEVDAQSRIMAWNFTTGADPVVAGSAPSQVSNRFGYQPSLLYPSIQGARVAWVQGDEREDEHGQLFMYDLNSGETAEGPSMLVVPYDLEDDLLTYNDEDAVFMHDLSSGESRQIADEGFASPVTDGRFVFWQERDSSYFNPPEVSRVQIYDSVADDYLPFPLWFAGGGSVVEFHASNGVVTWEGIHALRTSELLDDDLVRFFPETDYSVKFGLLNYWEGNGDIPVFGYPLTEQYGNRQYFERQRLEEHPQHLGTPYDVQLGLVGVEGAQARGITGHEAFDPLPDDTASDEHCMFFAETGHRLCHGFRAYWESNGLEFGDPGVSFRESLALFGYPISEEFVDSDTGYVTQYFQRARFEYHPDNEAPYDILLGRLGAELIEQGRLPSNWPY